MSAVIVNRGWVPLDFSESEMKEFQPQGNVSISGVIRLGLVDTTFKNGLGTVEADGSIRYWKYINLEKLSEQIPYEIESIYIEKMAKENELYPVPAFKDIEITQGPHLGYAIQWFFFAALLGGGYPVFIRKTLGEDKQDQREIEGEK
jgi:surfeit locus 1 family protein